MPCADELKAEDRLAAADVIVDVITDAAEEAELVDLFERALREA